MPQITLTRHQAQSLVSFCEAAKSESFFIAKDHGAYVGFSTGPAPEQQCLYYFAGCDPRTDALFYENAYLAFGGDDFGEHLPLTHLRSALAHSACKQVRITVTESAIHFDALT
ncbi:DUF3085 domain-containing protein [Cupriavidus agavae]|uniref:DUF3085 family protein n=1 Tax=Cupriavidus agavae TaxID=1001822 RepID=A0A4Q7R8A7_9BURK|nr:DUF3085 domain-containing protein [Cupriavidus agavae]RZT29083.1 DUF3085 family protein [Cupriavidus agavae]